MTLRAADTSSEPRWRKRGIAVTLLLGVVIIKLILSGAIGVAFGVVGLLLFATALWHVVFNHARGSGSAPVGSRAVGAVAALFGVAFFGFGVALAIPSATEEPIARAPEPSPSRSVDLQVPTAADALAELEIKGRAPKTGYSRDQFGQRWADVDRNGCDQRNDILNRDLVDVTFRPGTRDCVVFSGTLEVDPFTGEQINFVRGETTSQAVQIDHVVALSDAWQKGAQQLSDEQRLYFANDHLNLLAVDGPANRSKGDGDAATWLPRNRMFRCEYVAIQVAVKSKYDLWITQAEHDAIAGILASCPGQPLPDDSGIAAPAES